MVIAMLGILIAVGGVGETRDSPGVSDPQSLPEVRELPNPFVFQNGRPVKSRSDWKRRRDELKELVLRYEYGPLPHGATDVSIREFSKITLPATGSTEREVRLICGPGGLVSARLIITRPAGTGPYPVVVKGDLCWGRVDPAIVASANRRGYVVAEFDRTDFGPDSKELAGVYTAYPGYDGGRLSAWAWGFHRVVDFLLTEPYVDPKRIAITGHSRGGKAALLAGATDERIALTAPNNSGCGGAGCYRFQAPNSEDIAAITKNFPFWFDPKFPEFIGKIGRLPIDQHSVKALVAPRALLSTEALGDLWANPEGTQQSYMAAREVYRFLGAEDRIGIHFREGGHEQNAVDWETLLDFADKVFFNKPVSRRFDRLAFPNSAKAWSWSAPAAR